MDNVLYNVTYGIPARGGGEGVGENNRGGVKGKNSLISSYRTL